MSSPAPTSPAVPARIAHPIAGTLAPVRIGVRTSGSETASRAPAPPPAQFAADDLAAGTRCVGSIEIETELTHHGEAATLGCRVRNTSEAPLHLEAVIFGFRWRKPGSDQEPIRFLKNGWQSWSYTGVRELDPAGEPEFPSGPWLRGMHHVCNAPPADRAGWHESATVAVVGQAKRAQGGVCLVGVLETGRAFGVAYLRRRDEWIELEIEQLVEVPLMPGEALRLEDMRIALGDEPSRLLEAFAELWGRAGGARTRSPFQAGWCSWYYFFHQVSEADLHRNLEALVRERDRGSDGIPIDVVQLDDGYQRAIGDWLLTNEKFPSGLAALARRVREAGFKAGIWTAPFCVVPESLIAEQHPEWLLRWGDQPFNGTFHPVWSESGPVYALDTARDEVQEHLRSLFRELAQLGFDYFKLDFLHAAAMRADSAHPEMTRAARLKVGLQAIRAGAGDQALLLGCGSPLGPAVGIVDAMRIGPDVAPHWNPPGDAIPGLEPALPATRSAVRSILCRAWMHRRLWLNDPDCLMVRADDTQLTADEAHTLATAIAVTGGVLMVSDDLPALSAEGRALLRDTISIAREVDAAADVGTARCVDLLAAETPDAMESGRAHSSPIIALLNTSEEEERRDLERADEVAATFGLAASARSQPLLATRSKSPNGVRLRPRESALFRLGDARELAIFCDFDGTFSVQDVGASIADKHAGANRARLRELFLRGDITAWESNMELLDGLALSEPALDEFLHTIELDPGAKALIAWCDEREVPLLILSDGFDYNLDRLQAIHGVEFRYLANRLRYQDGCWRISPGHPNPACGCGTGTCKRAQIDAFRGQHPTAFCVHIGNGRVSDLCGALAADFAFAKDTLAPALAARGERFAPFTTLHDVVSRLSGGL